MEKKELSLQLNNINIGDFKMKKTNFAVAGLSLCLLFSSCGTNQKTGTAVGAGSGAALGALVGGLLNNSHRGTGALVGELSVQLLVAVLVTSSESTWIR